MSTGELILSLIPGGLAGAALAFLLRGWISERLKGSIQAEYNRELEAHKADLKRDNDVYLAQLKAEQEKAKQLFEHNLELARLEHQIRFSGSYNEVLDSIKEVHAKLVEIHRGLSSYTSIWGNTEGPEREEKRKTVGELVDQFWGLFNPKRIFFSETLDKEIVAYIHTVTNKGIEFMLNVEQAGTAPKVPEWNRIDKEVKEQWNTVLASIRAQFRAILGTEGVVRFEQIDGEGPDMAGAKSGPSS